MEQIMADLLIKLDFDIKDILNSDKRFKKWKIKKLIKEFAQKQSTVYNKTEYTARDIVNLALLVDIAVTMRLDVPFLICIDTTSYMVSCKKGIDNSRWPAVAELNIKTEYSNETTVICKFVAEMGSEIDYDGKIRASYETSHSRYSRTNSMVRTIESKTITNDDSATITERNLNQIAMTVLPNVFRVYHSHIVESLEKRWLSHENWTKTSKY